MKDQFAPWITDPDDPADVPTGDNQAAADAVFAAHPELVDKSSDGPFEALKQAAQAAIDTSGRDPAVKHIIQTFLDAINMLDQSEPAIRDLIETNLMDVAGINRTKVSDAMLTRDELSKRIITLRHHHIKAAFRHLRDNLPSDI